MPSIRTLQRAFVGGEVSPEMLGRVDDPRYQAGAARMRNMQPLPHGPAKRRPGLERINAAYKTSGGTNDGARLIDFRFNDDQAYAVEFGYENVRTGYVRFYEDGEPLTFETTDAQEFLPTQSLYYIAPGPDTRLKVSIRNFSTTEADIDTGAETFTKVSHGYVTGDKVGVQLISGSYPGATPAFSSGTDYYIIRVDADTFKVATSLANAQADTAINLTSAPAGTLAWAKWDMLRDGARFQFTVTAPAGATTGTDYYVYRDASTVWFVHNRKINEDGYIIRTPSAVTTWTNISSAFRRRYEPGELVVSSSTYYTAKTDILTETNFAATGVSNWLQQESDRIYTIWSPYVAADLFDVRKAQSNDVMTLVHPSYAPRELRRYAATFWSFLATDFAQPVVAPTGLAAADAADNYGTFWKFQNYNPGSGTGINVQYEIADSNGTTAFSPFAEGDRVVVFRYDGVADATGDIVSGIYQVYDVDTSTERFRLAGEGGNRLRADWDAFLSNLDENKARVGDHGICRASVSFGDSESYVVTAVDANDVESTPSSPATSIIPIYNIGAYNTLTWTASVGAVRYRVYKEQSGLYGYIGETEETTFRDDNIAQDMGRTPPRLDVEFSTTGEYPSAVAYFEQRKVFGGTTAEPQTVWMTRSNTESDLSYHLPVLDDDRIKFQIASREANTIRHIVPLNQLVLFSGSAEWVVRSVDNDALTPGNVGVRPQSYIGASTVQPVVVNNNIVFAAARGGHVREFGYADTAGGYLTGDLSLRATHLFDGLSVRDMAYSKAPYPIVYATSSNGRLLGMVYIPEEQIASWFWLDTDGLIESVCAVPEGLEDRLYVVVNLDGTRSVQRMAALAYTDLESGLFLDDHVAWDGTVTDGRTVTVTGGTYYTYGETLTITASSSTFTGSSDVGDEVVLYDEDDTEYRIEITGYTSGTVVTGRSRTALPAALRATAVSSWAIARRAVSGLTHLNSRTCAILADGEVLDAVVVAGGAHTLTSPAVKGVIGVEYASEIYTLPVAAQVEALGQGRSKDVNKAWLRVVDSGAFEIGPLGGDLVTATPETETGEVRVTLMPSWSDGGQIHIRQADPLPLTVVGMTLEVAVGG